MKCEHPRAYRREENLDLDWAQHNRSKTIQLWPSNEQSRAERGGQTSWWKRKQRAHMSACAATAFPSLQVGILCEHLVATARVDIHLLLCLDVMKILGFN